MKNIINTVTRYLKRNSSHIWVGIGLFSGLTAIGMAIEATPAAMKKVEEKKEELNKDTLTVSETVSATWKCYVPTVIAAATSASCIILGDNKSAQKNAALATAYSISETAAREYHDKVVKTIGEEKEASIRDSIAKDRIENHPIPKNEVIITGNGDTLCFDEFSKRYFKSNVDRIDRAINQLNYRMINDMSVSLNDYYYAVGLDCTRMGYDLGWNVNKGLIEVHYSSQLTDDGTPCLVVYFNIPPRYDYQSY